MTRELTDADLERLAEEAAREADRERQPDDDGQRDREYTETVGAERVVIHK